MDYPVYIDCFTNWAKRIMSLGTCKWTHIYFTCHHHRYQRSYRRYLLPFGWFSHYHLPLEQICFFPVLPLWRWISWTKTFSIWHARTWPSFMTWHHHLLIFYRLTSFSPWAPSISFAPLRNHYHSLNSWNWSFLLLGPF